MADFIAAFENNPILDFVVFFLIVFFSSMAAFVHESEENKTKLTKQKAFSHFVISANSCVVAVFGCIYFQLPAPLTVLVTTAAGYSGGTFLESFSSLMEKKIEAKVGMDSSIEKKMSNE
ncbi:MAG: phage holin family protein [Candidatus Thiodiazotropha endolucinida]|nr:phage holin family protein [Candidatus Thiodiazotropha taylori]MCW4321587.1 phage holin family protein [Candidatus Thiodiazotropha taylori]